MNDNFLGGHNWRIECGDAYECLRRLPDNAVNCVVTSPPYWGGLRNYGVDGQLGLEKSMYDYVDKMVTIGEEIRRVLRPDGTFWLNMGDSYNGSWGSYKDSFESKKKIYRNDAEYADRMNARPSTSYSQPGLKRKDIAGIPWRLAFALQDAGWYLRADIIWNKKNPMPGSYKDRPTSSHEYIFLLSKSPKYYYDHIAVMEPCQSRGVPNSPLAIKSPYGQSFARENKIPSGWDTGLGAHGDGSGNYSHGSSGDNKQDGTEKVTYIGFNSRYTPMAKRNKRDVWTFSTQPTKVKHYASYPTWLVEPCILAGTSEAGCCPACETPYKRRYEKYLITTSDHRLLNGHTGTKGRQWGGTPRGVCSYRTLGWDPICQCGAGDPVPCVVLDPFCGTGTTGVVSIRYGRRFYGIDLSPEYYRLAEDRIGNDMPLLANKEDLVTVKA